MATLGFNPSRLEFVDRDGNLLVGAGARLETLASLGLDSLSAADGLTVARVWTACTSYFHVDHSPYRRWFNQLEPILGAIGGSYYDGSACHVNLVQWATDPVWRGLSRSQLDALLDDGLPFLDELLSRSTVELLLVNGAGVSRIFERLSGARLTEATLSVSGARSSTVIRTGTHRNMRVISWSTNLQSSWGVTGDVRRQIAAAVAALEADRGSRLRAMVPAEGFEPPAN